MDDGICNECKIECRNREIKEEKYDIRIQKDKDQEKTWGIYTYTYLNHDVTYNKSRRQSNANHAAVCDCQM